MSKTYRRFDLLLLALFVAGCGGEKRIHVGPTQPYLSLSLRVEDRESLQQAALALLESDFAVGSQKLALTDIPATIKVSLGKADVATINAAKRAVESWNQALAGTLVIQEVDSANEAHLKVEFAPNVMEMFPGHVRPGCMNVRFKEAGSGDGDVRTAIVSVGQNRPGSNEAHSPRSIEHLVAKGIGTYLGLQKHEKAQGLMGADSHSDSVPVQPSEEDVLTIKRMLAFRGQLVDALEVKKPPRLEVPVLEFESTEHDGGTVWRGEVIHVTYEFRNSGKVPIELDAKPNCGCTVAKFDRVVEPGASGTITADFDTSGFSGQTTKHIEIISNSLSAKHPKLQIKAQIRPTFETKPSGPHTLAVAPESVGAYEFDIVPVADKNSRVLAVECPNEHLDATIQTSGYSTRVKLRLKPSMPEGRQYVSLKVKTDSEKEPEFPIPVIVEKGMCVMPKSLFLGRLDGQVQYPIRRTISLSQKSKPFRILKIETGDPKLAASVQTSDNGMEHRIRLDFAGGWPAGETRRTIDIFTSDSRNPKISIDVSAFVLGP